MSPERLYLKLFSTPSLKFLIPLAAFLVFSFLLFGKYIYLFYFFVFLISTVLAIKLLGLKLKPKGVLFFDLILILNTVISKEIVGNPIFSMFLFLVILYFCSESNAIKTTVYASIVYMLIYPRLISITYILTAIASFVVFLRVIGKIGILNVKEFLKSFTLTWLTSDASYVENYLKKVSEIFNGRVRCLKIGDAKIISTDFHPGPFRNVGGANMVKEISKRIENSIYLHSPTSHSRNPISRLEVKKIVSAVRCSGEKIKPLKPFKVRGKRFDLICFPFDKVKLIFVSGKDAIDDFVVNCRDFVVDCHNAYKEEFYMSENEIREIKKLLNGLNNFKREFCDVKYYFKKKSVETESICSYVAVLLLDFSGDRYAIVSIDSNNVLKEFREYIEKEFEKIGFEAIVTSTDNHLKTGIKTKVAYKPAGADEKDWIIVKELIEDCKNAKLKAAECYYSENVVGINVMGEEFVKCSNLAIKRYRICMLTLIALIALNFFIPVLLKTVIYF